MTGFLYAHAELFFCLCGLAWLRISRAGNRSLLCFAGYIAFVALFRDAHDTGMAAMHVLAMPHILVSWAAKTAVCMAVCWCLGGRRCPDRWLVRFCMVCVSASIILGMIWAFDAPGWGRLWQWDSVETYALCLFVCLWGWQKRTGHGNLWAYLCLLVLTCETLGLYGGFSTNSRHSYGAGADEWLCALGWMIWLVWSCVCAEKRRLYMDARAGSLERSGAWVLAGVLLVIFCGVEVMPLGMCIAFGAIWVCLNIGRHAANIAICLTGLACLAISIGDISTGWLETARLDADGGWQVLGIFPENIGECLRLGVHIASPEAHEGMVQLEACHGKPMQSSGFADIWPEMIRVYGVSYRAAEGVQLFVRPVAFERLCELALMLMWVFGGIVSIKKCDAEAEQYSYEQDLRCDV